MRKLNPKIVRQSVITNWFRQGHEAKDVQVMSGHKYPSNIESYKLLKIVFGSFIRRVRCRI